MRVTVPPRIASRRRKYRHLILGDYVSELAERAMDRLGIKQQALGEAIGVDHTKLSVYRHGISHPGEQERRLIVEHLDGDEDEMIARELADKILYLIECMGVTRSQRARAWRLMRGKDAD